MNNTYNIDQERWNKLDIFNQMGNIYSEVGRSFKAKQKADTNNYNQAISRAIDLFDATIHGLIVRRSPQAKEVLRAKEEFLNLATDDKPSKAAVEDLDRYFRQFAVAARLNR